MRRETHKRITALRCIELLEYLDEDRHHVRNAGNGINTWMRVTNALRSHLKSEVVRAHRRRKAKR